MKCVMVLYNFDINLIWATAIPSKTKLQLVTAYKHIFSLMQRRSLHPHLQRLENECSDLLKEFMNANNVAYQLTPKGKKSRNSANKAIQTWKYHFLSGMASNKPDFPLSQWCKPF